MEPTRIDHYKVALTINQLAALTSVVIGRAQMHAPDKPKGMERLRIAMAKRLGSGSDALYERVVLAGSCQMSLEILREQLISDNEKNGKPTARLEAATINGMGVEFIQAKTQKENAMNASVDTDGEVGSDVPTPVVTDKKGRKSEMSGKIINCTVKPNAEGVVVNPRKPGSHGFRSMAIVMDNPGITTEKYLELGGRLNDLKWDVDHGFVSATDPSTAAVPSMVDAGAESEAEAAS